MFTKVGVGFSLQGTLGTATAMFTHPSLGQKGQTRCSKTGGFFSRTPEGKGEGMLLLKAFIKVLDCVPAATGQVAAYRALGSAVVTLREEGYANIRP